MLVLLLSNDYEKHNSVSVRLLPGPVLAIGGIENLRAYGEEFVCHLGEYCPSVEKKTADRAVVIVLPLPAVEPPKNKNADRKVAIEQSEAVASLDSPQREKHCACELVCR